MEISSNWGRVQFHVAPLCIGTTAKGALAYPFQHNDICSHSAGEINWYLQPIWAWEVFTSSILGINAEAFVSFYHAI